MVKNFIKCIGISICVLGLVGCGESQKEMVFKEGDKGAYENSKVKIEKLTIKSDKENFDIGDLVLGGYDNKFYGYMLDNNCGFANDNNQLNNKFDPNRYVITREGKLVEDSKEAVYLGENKDNEGVGFEKDKNGKIVGLFYYNQEKELKKDIKKIDNGEKLKLDLENPFPVVGVVENNSKYVYFQVVNTENREKTKESLFEIIDVETKKTHKIDVKEERVAKVVYLDGFYILQDDLTLIKLGENFKIEKTIDLSKEFGYTKNNEKWIENASLIGDELVINGSNEEEITENNKGNFINSFIIKYNLKTGEKKSVDLGIDEELEELNIRSFNPKTNTIIISKKSSGKEDFDLLLGKVIDDKVKILKKLDLGERGKPYVSIIDIAENQKGDELMIMYSITNNGQYDESEGKVASIKIDK